MVLLDGNFREMEWSDDYSVGDPHLDQQHQELFKLVKSISDYEHLTVFSREFHDLLHTFTMWGVNHFRDELDYLRKIDYPEIKEHLHLHVDYVATLAKLSLNAMDCVETSPKELIAFINHWWFDHVVVVDQKYHRFAQGLPDSAL